MKIRNDFVTNSSSSSFIITSTKISPLNALRECLNKSVSYETEVDGSIQNIREYMDSKTTRSIQDENYEALEKLLASNPEYKYFLEADISNHDDYWMDLIDEMNMGRICLW